MEVQVRFNKTGIGLGALGIVNLEKTEENTLYIIELEKRIKELEKMIKEIQKGNE
jgi:hypothetical protein